MKRGLSLCISMLLLFAVGFAGAEAGGDRAEQLHALSVSLLEHIKAGEEAQALDMMDEAMRGYLTGAVATLWPQLTSLGGAFEKTGAWKMTQQEGFDIIEMTLIFANARFIQRTVFDQDGKVAGFFVAPGEVEGEEQTAEVPGMPAGIREEAVTVDAGTGYPLKGTLTLPEGEPVCGLVLVHGSGPADQDETVLVNKPFLDLAWGLAQQGIAVLRYDKRTFTYGEQIAGASDYPSFTVDLETAEDAAAAVQLLKAHPALAGREVFLLGHSLGGMLTAYINTKGAGASGYINLAGSPRRLWEISADQNIQIAEELAAAGDNEAAEGIRLLVNAAQEKANNLLTLGDADALKDENQVLGISAWYLRHLEGIDPVQLHLADGLPVLILQGERDRQVTLADYEAWKKGLQGHPAARFKSYPGLNHLFGQFEGEAPAFQQLMTEYSQRTPVAEAVLEDIAAWLREHSQ